MAPAVFSGTGYWCNFVSEVAWEDEKRSVVVEYLAGILGPLVDDIVCPDGRPTIAEFKACLARTKGCPGIDGWSKDEMRFVANSPAALSLVWRSMEVWEKLERTPVSVQHCRVACLQKESKVVSNTLVPQGFRPVSILSIWWRAWSACWLRSQWVSSWSSAMFPRTIAGGLPGALGPEVMAALIDVALEEKVALDFRHAFDSVDLALMRQVTERILPPSCRTWTRLLFHQWEHLQKRFSLGGHVHPESLKAPCGLPQGDPASPLMMTLLLRVGFAEVQRELGERVDQFVFMDDRTVVAPSTELARRAQSIWQDFARRAHLLEHPDKAQLLDIGQLSGDPDARPWGEVLGSLVGLPDLKDVKQCSRLLSRLGKAVHMAKRVGFTPLGVQKRLKDLILFVRSSFVYGWIAVLPPAEWISRYDQALWRAAGRLRYSVKGLRSVLAGASIELRPAILLRQLRVLATRINESRLLNWNAFEGSLDRLVSAHLCQLNWSFQGGRWQHAELGQSFSFEEILDVKRWSSIAHWIRESWRIHMLIQTTPSHRHELRDVLLTLLDARRIPLVRSWIGECGQALVAAFGAVQSPNVRVRGNGNAGMEFRCPKCGEINPFWDHIWTCLMNMEVPEDVLLARFLWPRCVEDFPTCNQFLEHLARFSR